jgi:hypothetical protein
MEVLATTLLLNRRYLVLENVGRGGMGAVYRAFDRVAERAVALKVLWERSAAGPGHPLTEEFRTWTRVRHPNVVRVLGLERVVSGPFPPGTPCLVLEYFDGLPVDLAFRPGRIPMAVLESTAREVLRALAHVHARGLVHRDLKPGNVLVGKTWRGARRVKITDFGLASVAGSSDEPGCVSGSLPYVAPESIVGRRVDGRADLYALGILLYLLTTGRLPFRRDRAETILRWHLGGPEADPEDARPGLPRGWRNLIRRLTARDPDRRPSSAGVASRLIGDRQVSAVATSAEPGDRPWLVSMRRSMDRLRLGGSGTQRLPRDRRLAGRFLADVRALCDLYGLGFYEVRSRPTPEASLGRVVIEMLLARETGIAGLVDKYGLRRGLPLEILGGLPVWDRTRAARGREGGDTTTDRWTARGVAGFLADDARRRPLALAVHRAGLSSFLVRETVRLLRDEVVARSSGPNSGGLLLIAEESAEARE